MKKTTGILGGMLLLALMIMGSAIRTERVEAKAIQWGKEDSESWSNNKDHYMYYVSDNKLIKALFEPHSWGIQEDVATWKLKSDEYLKIASGAGNYLYVAKYSEGGGSSMLYAVNYKTKRKKKVANKCYPMCSTGKYIIGSDYNISDTGAYSMFVWKVSGASAQKVKTIGKHIYFPQIYKGKLYYASYPDGLQRKMTVYRSNPNGTKRKKLFSKGMNHKDGSVLIGEISSSKIPVTVSENNKIINYAYSLKTGKLKKK